MDGLLLMRGEVVWFKVSVLCWDVMWFRGVGLGVMWFMGVIRWSLCARVGQGRERHGREGSHPPATHHQSVDYRVYHLYTCTHPCTNIEYRHISLSLSF
jgi:hypothetical protein